MQIPRHAIDLVTHEFMQDGDADEKLQRAASQAQGVESLYRVSVAENAGDPDSETTPPVGVSPLQLGSFDAEGFSDWYRYSWWSAGHLLKPIALPFYFLIDSFGDRAWKGMKMHSRLLFEDSDPAHWGHQEDIHGLSALLKELHDLQTSYPDSAQAGLLLLANSVERVLQKLQSEDYDPYVEQLIEQIEYWRRPGQAEGRNLLIEGVEQLGPRSLRQETLPSSEDDESEKAIPVDEVIDEDRLNSLVQTFSLLASGPGDDRVIARLSDGIAALRKFSTPGIDRSLQTWRDEVKTFLGGDQELTRTLLDRHLRSLHFILEQAILELQEDEIEFSIFAHSMGAIVVNEVLERSQWQPVPRFRNLVYMAPACSIVDYEEAMFPYLRKHKEYGSKFYNLMLHPRAEDEEMMFYDLIPRGSLLVYVDQFFTQPSTPRESTLGRFENVFRTVHATESEIADQVHFRVFPAGAGSEGRELWEDRTDTPETHGEFTPSEFWKTSFWRVPSVIEASGRGRARRQRRRGGGWCGGVSSAPSHRVTAKAESTPRPAPHVGLPRH